MNVLIVTATHLEITSKKIEKKSILVTGLGMVNTAISLCRELIENDYDLVINMGIAGSFSEELKNGDVVEVIEDSFSEIGFEDGIGFSPFVDLNVKTRHVNNAKTNLRKVTAITVNTVHGNKESIQQVTRRLNPDIETMEGAAVFQVCQDFQIPCIQIRSISNKVEIRNKDNWNLDLAIKRLNLEVEKVIDDLCDLN